MMKALRFCCVVTALLVVASLVAAQKRARTAEQKEEEDKEDRKFWKEKGRKDLDDAIKKYSVLNERYAKNSIVVIGDGMSLGTTVAGRIKTGQDQGMSGEEYMTSLDTMPHVGLAKTYSVDNQVPDSSATATAILSGIKTDNGRLGVDTRGESCWKSQQFKVKTALHHAIEQGKSIGLVTTTRVQHATPASAYAHSPTRFWYSDDNMNDAQRKYGCIDISQQLFNLRHKIQVILGGGRAHMTPRGEVPEGGKPGKATGKRKDGQNLIKMWKEEMEPKNGSYVSDRESFNNIDPAKTDYLLGLFTDFEFNFVLHKNSVLQPTLEEMSEKAIQILSKNPKGYFLLVESGMIDKGHHGGRAAFAIAEFQRYDEALNKIRSMTSSDDTLLIATADHGHVFTMGGVARRGNPVLGTANNIAKDKKMFTTISYGNGPGYTTKRNVGPKIHLSKWHRPIAAVPLNHESHSAEDVAIWSDGPHAHLLNGVHEQNFIGHVLFYAACLGPDNVHWPHCPPEVSVQGKFLIADQEDDLEMLEYLNEFEDVLFPGDDIISVSHIH